MMQRINTWTKAGAIALMIGFAPAVLAAPPVSLEREGVHRFFWTQNLHKAMDTNKDGMVSRTEYMNYLAAQFDKMDQGKKGMLSMKDFTDSKMMSATFPGVMYGAGQGDS